MKYTVILITICYRIFGLFLMVANGYVVGVLISLLALGLTGPEHLAKFGKAGPALRVLVEIITFLVIFWFGYYSVNFETHAMRRWFAGSAAALYIAATFSSLFGVRKQVVWPT